MRNLCLVVVILSALAIASCKKEDNCDSNMAKIRFENTTPDDLSVDISRKGEWNSEFRDVDISFYVPSYGFSEREIEAGDRYIRWSDCQTGGGSRCTEIFTKEATYAACKSYTELSKQ